MSRPDHGLLQGLTDDDHPQYFDQTRLDAWWAPKEAALDYLPLAGGTITGTVDFSSGTDTAIRFTSAAGPSGIGFAPDGVLQGQIVYRTSPDSINLEDHLGNEILEVVVGSTQTQLVQSHKIHYFTPAGTIGGAAGNMDQAGILVGTLTQGVGIDDNEITFKGASGYVNAYDGVLVLGSTSSVRLASAAILEFVDGNTQLKEGSNNAVRVQTNSGYIDIGPQNVNYAHIYTDRGSFYFNKGAFFIGAIQRLNGDYYTQIGIPDATWGRIETTSARFYFNKQVRANGGFAPYTNQVHNLGETAQRFASAYVGSIHIGATSSDDGLGAVSGSYGSVQTIGSGAGGFEGYSIAGHTVFMAAAAGQNRGIYDDNQNRWMIVWENETDFDIYHPSNGERIVHADINSYTYLYYNGLWSFRTTSYGVETAGDIRLGNLQTVQFNGNLYNSNGSWACYYETDEPSAGLGSISTTYSSSARYKLNIRPHSMNPRAVLDAKLREWDWDRDAYELVHGIRPKDPAWGPPTGLVADEVYEVEPRIIAVNGIGEPERILDGRPLQDAMLAALQHLDERIAILEAA
ncbi:MAG: hypothetical protein ABFR89_02470 [Actinomycetota bacterium]